MSPHRRFLSSAVFSPMLIAASQKSRNNQKSMAWMLQTCATPLSCGSLSVPELLLFVLFCFGAPENRWEG